LWLYVNLLVLKKIIKHAHTKVSVSSCFLFVDPIAELFFAGFLGTLLTDGKIPSAGDVLSGAANVYVCLFLSPDHLEIYY
jgi:hypothetical protein